MRIHLAAGLLLAAALHAAEPLRFESGPSQVALIELYTSEGCSSCPPADRWLGCLRDKPGLWREFVPVEFHVDYWNGLGWRDRLSSRDYTDRQYAYASVWGNPSVYTPCFVRNGAEWKPQWGGPAAAGGPGGSLSVEVAEDGRCRARYRPAPGARAGAADYAVHVALLGGGVISRVTAGENDGATLGHEFVVLGTASGSLAPGAAPGALQATVMLPRSEVAGLKRRAIAVWVTRRNELIPLQATGGWLP
jgi:hypothetical protein